MYVSSYMCSISMSSYCSLYVCPRIADALQASQTELPESDKLSRDALYTTASSSARKSVYAVN
jgi:hypothetical protein